MGATLGVRDTKQEIANNNKTSENKQYGGDRTTCTKCGLTDVGVANGVHLDTARCTLVREGKPLGPAWLLQAPNRYDLTPEEQLEVTRAVNAYLEKRK